MKAVIIGGGIAGLAAAYELEKAKAAGASVEYALYEAHAQLGGVLSSETVDGIVLERGPDSFLTEKPAAAELCRELGLGADLISSNDAARKTYIVVNNELVALPDGLMFMVPTKLIPTAMSRLFSFSTKVRMGLDLFHPPRSNAEDESVAALVARHFGEEAVERLADPLLSGIYGGDAAQLSARSVLPRLVEMERAHGSLTRGMLAAHREMRARARNAARNASRAASSSPEGSTGTQPRTEASRNQPGARPVFTSLRGGVRQMVDALAERLDSGSIHCSRPVSSLKKVGSGWLVEAGGAPEVCDAVIVAAPAWAAGVLLAPVDAAIGHELGSIPYSSSITVNLVYDEARLRELPEGFGFLIPASEGRAMLACTFVHRKFLGRAPQGKAVLRAFLGGMRHESLLAEPDDVLVAIVRQELKEIMGIDAEPERTQVARWRRAMAQYAVGHQKRIKRITGRLAALPGLRLVGNAYDGIGISDCIRLGRTAARDLVAASKSANERAN